MKKIVLFVLLFDFSSIQAFSQPDSVKKVQRQFQSYWGTTTPTLTNIFAQTDSIFFYANIKNQEFEPLSYSNIDFLNKKKKGTVSDEKGYFKIKVSTKDTLIISHVGYKKIICPVVFVMANDTFRLYRNIILTDQYKDLQVVNLSAQKRSIRYKNYGSRSTDKAMALGVVSENLGYEFGAKIKIPNKRNVKLEQFNCFVTSSNIDSIKFRINIYQFNNIDSTLNLLNQNYIITSKTKNGELNFDMRNEKIYLKDEILISLEVIEVYGKGSIYFSTSTIGSGTYYRTGKQASWNKFPIIEVALNIDVKLF